MEHMEVGAKDIFHAYAPGVGGKAHGDAGRALGAVPQVGAHAVGERRGDSRIETARIVEAFVDNAQVFCIDILPCRIVFGHGGGCRAKEREC